MQLVLGYPILSVIIWLLSGLILGVLVTIIKPIVQKESVILDISDVIELWMLSWLGPAIVFVYLSVMLGGLLTNMMPENKNKILIRGVRENKAEQESL